MAPRQRSSKGKAKEEKAASPLDHESHSEKTTETKEPFRIPWKKIVTRFLLSALLVLVVYWTSNKEEGRDVFAKKEDELRLESQAVPCSAQYTKDVAKFKGCASKQCGRLVTDVIVSPQESAHLLQLCKKGLSLGGSSGGASILDLHSGALSQGDSFVNVYQKVKAEGKKNLFTSQDFKVYRSVRRKIQQTVAFNFGVEANRLHLTHPTFFSEMTSRPAQTRHDEYWHVHVDKETYPSFHYTSLLYLADYGDDFTGGRFVFVDPRRNITIEPKIGRVSAFTSGSENAHFVERVKSGRRYALTVSFTCDPAFAIDDPSESKFQ